MAVRLGFSSVGLVPAHSACRARAGASRRPSAGSLAIWLCLLCLLAWRAVIPNGYMLDPAAARAGHYALMPCPAKGWRWPSEHLPAAGHAAHAAMLTGAAAGEHDAAHVSVDCPTAILLAQAMLPTLWWPPVLALVPSRSRPLPPTPAPRVVFGPICGPPVGAQAPPCSRFFS